MHTTDQPQGQQVQRSTPRAPPSLPPPITIRVSSRQRDIVTGGGLCDPGRCEPKRRPQGRLLHLTPGVIDIFSKHDLPGKLRTAVINRSKRTPFDDVAIQEGRNWLVAQVNLQRGSADPQAGLHIHESQPFLLNLMHALGTLAGAQTRTTHWIA